MKKAKPLLASALVTLLILTFSISCLASNDQYITNVKEELPYEYSFSKKYVVAGKRVLDLTIHNKTDYDIKALEVEIRVKDAFKEVISGWSTFTDPKLEISAHSSGKTRLTLTKKSLLGTTVENVLDEAKYIDLRYKRILFEGDVLLKKRDLYPELKRVQGSFKFNIKPVWELTQKQKQKSLTEVDGNWNSALYSAIRGPWQQSTDLSTVEDVIERNSPQGALILHLKATNVSKQPVQKDWTENSPSLVELIDNKKNQYTNHAMVFTTSRLESVAEGKAKLRPGNSIELFYLYGKTNDNPPEKLTVYIEGQKYGQINYKE